MTGKRNGAECPADPREFALRSGRWKVRLDFADLDPRVGSHPLILGAKGPLDAEVAGGVLSGLPYLDISVRAELVLQCQRCLGELDYGLDRTDRLRLFRTEEELEEYERLHPDEEGALCGEEDFDPEALVEDLVLLSIPLVPKHEEGGCEADLKEMYSDAPVSPFAALKGARIEDDGPGEDPSAD